MARHRPMLPLWRSRVTVVAPVRDWEAQVRQCFRGRRGIVAIVARAPIVTIAADRAVVAPLGRGGGAAGHSLMFALLIEEVGHLELGAAIDHKHDARARERLARARGGAVSDVPGKAKMKVKGKQERPLTTQPLHEKGGVVAVDWCVSQG